MNIGIPTESLVQFEVVSENMGKDLYGYVATIPITIQNDNLQC